METFKLAQYGEFENIKAYIYHFRWVDTMYISHYELDWLKFEAMQIEAVQSKQEGHSYDIYRHCIETLLLNSEYWLHLSEGREGAGFMRIYCLTNNNNEI